MGDMNGEGEHIELQVRSDGDPTLTQPLLDDPVANGGPDPGEVAGVEQTLAESEIRNILWINILGEEQLYKVAKETWEGKEALFTERIDRKNKQSLSLRNEVYQLIGFYSVFQGVLLTGATQSNLLHCNNAAFALTLSSLAASVTIAGVLQKFYTIWCLETTIIQDTYFRRVAIGWLESLKQKGEDFNFSKDTKEPTSKPATKKRDRLTLLFSIIAVIAVLVCFSGTFLAALRQILCNPGGQQTPDSSPSK